jgi:hypothetical protein
MRHRRRAFCQQACRTLIWSVAAFGVLQLSLGVAIEFCLSEVRDPEYAGKLERLEARRAERPDLPLVVCLGSSRTLTGMQAARLSTEPQQPRALVFNFGVSGGGPVLQLVCLKRLLAAGVRPDLVVVEVLPAVYNQPQGRAIEETWFNGARLRTSELHWLDPYHSNPSRLLRQWAKSRFLPCYRHQDLYSDDSEGDPHDDCAYVDGYGWRPTYRKGVPDHKRGKLVQTAYEQYRDVCGPFRLSAGAAQALRDILERCRQEHIPAALLVMPEGAIFQTWYPPDMRAGIDEFLGGTSREYGVPLIDARTWVAEEDFWDSHHLLPSGAAAFTERFEHEALAPLLETLPR